MRVPMHWTRLTRYLAVAAVFLAALHLSLAPISGQQPTERIPLTLGQEVSGDATKGSVAEGKAPHVKPVWVSSRAFATKSDTATAWELIPEHYRRRYERTENRRQTKVIAARSAGNAEKLAELERCPSEPTLFYRSGSRANQDLTSMVRGSVAIYAGLVQEVDGGFIEGRLGSLVLIEVTEILKEASIEPTRELLVEYPYADFAFHDNQRFCLRPDRQPAVPAAGDPIVVFVLYAPHGDSNLVVSSRSEEVVFFSVATGSLSLPKTLREDATLAGLTEFEALVAKARQQVDLLATRGELLP